MRFACIDSKLIPEKLLTSPEQTSPISTFEQVPAQPLNPDYPYNKDLQQQLSGKQLLIEDLIFPLSELQAHYENGYLLYRKGIISTKNKPTCTRCGNHDPHYFAAFPCARCKEECTYCRKCLMMGRVSACTPLLSWTGPLIAHETNPPQLSWDGTLSTGQQLASERVVQAIKENKELLCWAVCGAGKTEVLFQGIDAALTAGKRVCLATPRTDVVLELTPRLKKVFPSIPVASLYGGSEDRHLNAPLTIATTHQLLRFYQAFDAVILDEVDAFPYSVDESLQYAVRQSRKPTSSMIYLTATPNEKWQADCRQGKRDYVTIPARFHRHPLPVPVFHWCGNWEKGLKKERLPANVLQWIKKRLLDGKQCLLFVPKIERMNDILPLVRKLHPKIEAVHAEDPNRKEKVQAMRKKDIPILLTTTILERGVTFPNIDVAVLGAEDRIFTESALVQIAGRVGRSAQAPSGEIIFFHYGKTNAMIRARKQITRMNEEARMKGLIDH
ncbi:competence protein ComFA [Cytobacillus eiseniae]|uniref:Competence protein ComFA n=1 Tax=Cytobacillus eiseniae TaxID=762947 RepID=A0ABS4RGS2_9BACI|nr:DEAD/DEAH box helicase [Cytobacillus eiseniae]MBP2241973.1 competence protein ComFA [Cytobacillus eiseniae]